MGCLYLMSDKRAMYAIAGIAATFALVLGLITAVPASTVATQAIGLPMIGHAEVVLKDMDGNIKAYQQSDNVIPVNGQNCSADLLFGIEEGGLCDGTAAQFTDIRIGSDTNNPAAATDTQLVADLGFDGTGELTAEDAATSSTGAIKTIVGTFVLTGATTVGEVGLFDDSTIGADMFSRIDLTTPITAGTDDTVTITYEIEVG